MRPRSARPLRAYRSLRTTTNSSRVAMLTRLIPTPTAEHRRVNKSGEATGHHPGAFQTTQCGTRLTLIVARHVVMGHGAGATLLHRQARLGTVQRLDLTLLIDGQNHGMGRRIDIEVDDVA